MVKRVSIMFICIAIALIILPVAFAQIKPGEARRLHGVSLQDTTYQEVHFTNPAADIELSGMLFLPEGDGPFPAVVVIHGSGSSKRDNQWYLTFTTYLQEHGIAVLLPDKRGSESSAGDWRGASFEDLATDTVAAMAFLRASYPQLISEIGVLGASQGGQVVPIVAAQSDDVAYAINLVGSVVPFHEALIYEEDQNLREMGFLPGISNAIGRVSAWTIRQGAQREFWAAIGNYDPLPYWDAVDVPALAMFGELDPNTPSQRSAARLNGLDKATLAVVVFEGSGHALEDPPGIGTRYFREDALVRLRDFIHAATASN